ncbi:MAG: hypothetical protein MUF75_01800 [Bacteroidia bacterium]|jgi:hypothetical protein|nr:hypothetical protein [Bacteroidia bacterium]
MILLISNILFYSFFISNSSFLKHKVQWKEIEVKECATLLKGLENKCFAGKNYSYSVVYESYKDYTTENVYSEGKGFIKRKGNYWAYGLMDRLIVQDSKYKVTVDLKDKTIRLAEPMKAIDEDDVQSFTSSSLWTNCRKTFTFSSQSMNGIRIELAETEGVVAKECYYNESQILKMVYYYRTSRTIRKNNETKTEVFYPRMEVIIRDFRKDVSYSAEELSTKTFLNVKGEKISPTYKYSNFKVIDERIIAN